DLTNVDFISASLIIVCSCAPSTTSLFEVFATRSLILNSNSKSGTWTCASRKNLQEVSSLSPLVKRVYIQHFQATRTRLFREIDSVNWKRFQRSWKNYEIGSRLKELRLEMRTATLLTCIGPDALDILEGLDFEEESQRNNIDIVMKKLEEYCVGETNEIYERYCFNKRDQEIYETVELYVTVLRKLAKTCNFGTLENSLIRDRLVVGIRDNNIRKRLLQVSKLTLKDAIDICRSYESTCLQLKAMSQEAEVHKVDKAKPGFERSLKRVGSEPKQTVELYVTVLRKLAKTCNFGTLENSLIRDRLVVGIRDNNIRKRLLQVSKLTLKDAIDICRSYETISEAELRAIS
ncbi:Retrovirus-related Pol poly from transposon, partial [Paramuricea clavata]